MSEGEFESERQKLQDLKDKAIDLNTRLNEAEKDANGDVSLLSQIEQVRKTLKDKAQQLLDTQAIVNYVSQKRKEEQKLSSSQIVDESALNLKNGALSTSTSRNEEDALIGYSHIEMTPQQSFYQLSSLHSGKEPTSSATNPLLQEYEGFAHDPVLIWMQNQIAELYPNFSTTFSEMAQDEFESERQKLQALQGKAVG
ncbi:MAG: hypothetical protein JNJ47_08560, partial [Alphaproteobacteria bacterium]|nr:hypothetical protein [Alphaproteobacteria bacterium]